MEHRSIIKNRKGQMNDMLRTVAAVFIILLTLGVTVIAFFIALDAVSGENIIARRATVTSFINSTVNLTHTTTTISAVANLTDVVLENIIVTNANGTAVEEIFAGNFTISANQITASATVDTAYNQSNVNVTAVARHTVISNAKLLSQNATSGTLNFFTAIPSIMNILGAVIIIMAVVLMVIVVMRFRKESDEGL